MTGRFVHLRRCTASRCLCGRCGSHGQGWPPEETRINRMIKTVRRGECEADAKAEEPPK